MKLKIQCVECIMLVLSYLRKFREWGFIGVVTFVNNHLRNYRIRKILLGNARRYPENPQRGVTIIADLSSNTSLSKAMRDFCCALKNAGVPYQTFDLTPVPSVKSSDVVSLLTPLSEFRTLKYLDVVEMLDSPFPKGLPVRVSTIAFWEFESAFLDVYPFLLGKSCVIGMSDFNVRYYRRALPTHIDVQKILYPFRIPTVPVLPTKAAREKFKIPAESFVVFFNFDYASSCGRKNPDGCIRAFAKAFANEPSAMLMFKTMRAASHPESVAAMMQLARELGVADRLVSVDDYLSDADLLSLTNTCDVYLSLHRGEGFGLGIAEAMSLGKPVVVTDWSTPTEFCKDGCALRVPFKFVPVPEEKKDHLYYKTLKEWAEPDIDAASEMLRRLYADVSLREKMGRSAWRSIRDQFDVAHFKDSVEKFISRE